jgi:tetratricopeptide (TPR) repeat protein
VKIAFALLTGSLMAAENPRVEYAMGVRAEEHGNGTEAAARFGKALSLDPQALPLVEKVVEFKLAEGDRAGAVKLWRELSDASPDRLDVQLAYAGFLEQQGHGDALAQKLAVEVLEMVLEKRPGELSVIARLLVIFRERGDQERAMALMEALPQEDPQAAEIYASTSRTLFKESDSAARQRVDERYAKALAAHPKDPSLARVASEYFRTTDRLDRAIEVLAEHIKVAPWSLDLRTRQGVLLFSAKRDEEGEAALKEVIEIRPKSELALQSLTKFYRLKGDEKQARYYGAELLKWRGGSPREFVVLADELLAADEPRAARLLLEKGVFDHPERQELTMKLAVATRRDPETRAKASRLFREAEAAMGAQLKPDADFLIESAECLIEEGQSKSAEERLRTAIRSYPPERKKETAAALRRLAGLWEKENRNLDAARSLKQRADTLDPP